MFIASSLLVFEEILRMSINTSMMTSSAAPAPGTSFARPEHRLNGSQTSFRQVLGQGGGEGASGITAEQRAVSTAEQLVAVALVQPLLAQMRESSNAAPPFAPTQAEKQIRALQDASVAQQIVHASRFPMVDRLARGMLDRAERQGGDRMEALAGSNNA